MPDKSISLAVAVSSSSSSSLPPFFPPLLLFLFPPFLVTVYGEVKEGVARVRKVLHGMKEEGEEEERQRGVETALERLVEC